MGRISSVPQLWKITALNHRMSKMDIHAPLDLPVETLLATGGDSRLVAGVVGSLSKYLCATSPCPDVAPFGSCTASSISEAGYQAAVRLHRHLRALANSPDVYVAVAEHYEAIREELLFMLTKCKVPGVEVALTPSGTDAELLALAIAHGSGERSVTNILLAPTEVGSGTPRATTCRFFDKFTPSGDMVDPGSPVDARLAERTHLVNVAVRDELGSPRSESDIDAEVVGIVEERLSRGHRILLHVIAHSKTGLHAPSLSCVERLRSRFGEDVLVMIDAAQGRFSRRGLVRVLRAGHLVLLTGSKFYGGPPFSGALLVPASATPSKRNLGTFPPGFAKFFMADQFPASWAPHAIELPESGNLGLLLRWAAAIAEMREYYNTPSKIRLQVLREFERAVPEILDNSSSILLGNTVSPVLSEKFDRVLQSKTTVFSFSVTLSSGLRLDTDALRTVWRWLNDDISNLLPNGSTERRRILAPRLHLGQPVTLCKSRTAPAVLRIALGGVLLSSVAHDPTWGQTYQDRVARLHDKIIELKRKLDVIAAHYDELVRSASPHVLSDAV